MDAVKNPVFIEIEYEDGGSARWVISADDPNVDTVGKLLEDMLGPPNTITL